MLSRHLQGAQITLVGALAVLRLGGARFPPPRIAAFFCGWLLTHMQRLCEKLDVTGRTEIILAILREFRVGCHRISCLRIRPRNERISPPGEESV